MLSIVDQGSRKIPFTVIGSDAGLLSAPVTTSDLTMAMAERWEIVVDFTSYAGQNLTMKNARDVFKDDDYFGTDRVMRFKVGTAVTSTAGNGAIPNPLANLHLPPKDVTVVDRSFRFERR
jgi:bilirubin oxidase